MPETPNVRSRVPDRAAILRAAAELFARNGYRATTMDEIAEEVRIAKPTLYVHMRSKPAILEGIVDELISGSEERLEAALAMSGGTEWIRVLLKVWLEHSLEMAPHLHAYLSDRRELDATAQDRFRKWSKSVDHRITAKVAEQQRAGELRDDVDPSIVAYALIALVNWTPRWFTEEGDRTVDGVVDDYWSLLSHGLDLNPSAP
jgi:TetR/AcrR family transcriptional regulator, cholesterol catabolism regulator